MKVTPDYFHCITDKRFRSSVYEPEADTFLLLEALDKDADLLHSIKPRRCLEIGCGSGTVISHLQLILSGVSGDFTDIKEEIYLEKMIYPEYHAVDVNPIALEAANMTWNKTIDKTKISIPTTTTTSSSSNNNNNNNNNNSNNNNNEKPVLHLHQGDLFSPFEEKNVGLSEEKFEKFDIIIFNPPYVPTSMEEFIRAGTQEDFITAAWCGGPRGRVVVDRFISSLPYFLSDCGICYIVAISENDIPELMEIIRVTFSNMGASVLVEIAAERYTGEHLKIIRVQRHQESILSKAL